MLLWAQLVLLFLVLYLNNVNTKTVVQRGLRRKILAAANIAIAAGAEALEPDDLLPAGLPVDDIARRAAMIERDSIRASDG
jgi:hypothetical protein